MREYHGVTTRFLHPEERLFLTHEKDMPLVIEAKTEKSLTFLKDFITTHSEEIRADMTHYGAVLLRGFKISSDKEFEEAILSLQSFEGIEEAFMSEEGRVHPDGAKFVLHTNAVYKTGGTLYLGGFHSENYYSADVPSYICFCCLKPSQLGGETGMVNMQKVYELLNPALKEKLEQERFFVTKWLLSTVANRYKLSIPQVEEICKKYDLPLLGEGKNRFILMYKPNVFTHSQTHKKALQINFFEIEGLNEALRTRFNQDYQGKSWFWHRLIWRFPKSLFYILERIYIAFASFFYSPKDALHILSDKLKARQASKYLPSFNHKRVGTCFTDSDIQELATLMRDSYSSCLWQQGDILLIDNQQTVHAGMPGFGDRLIRALIGNPLEMQYTSSPTGVLVCKPSKKPTVGYAMKNQL